MTSNQVISKSRLHQMMCISSNWKLSKNNLTNFICFSVETLDVKYIRSLSQQSHICFKCLYECSSSPLSNSFCLFGILIIRYNDINLIHIDILSHLIRNHVENVEICDVNKKKKKERQNPINIDTQDIRHVSRTDSMWE